MGGARLAIVGIGLRYPDASDPAQLWENVLAGRRAFRRLPAERMNPADYYSADPDAPDRFYTTRAAVLRDYEFDRAGYRVAGSTYRSTDLTHWLALETAAAALADAGFPGGEGLPGPRTGVVLGNSLTGEFSRANLMRLRWPYVRRSLAATLAERGWDESATADLLRDLEPRYKAPFPAIDEDTLAGGLSNTIAGRICNHFDLGGGGYTVDGACSSSLLSVATAAQALAEGDLDVAVAGGVDLSIDPFEVIGFAKTGALAKHPMKVYDKNSNGFWPGEGCGMLVLMREEDALARGARVYAAVTGWGISSDGRGGITRPEAAGHRRALSRAYERAGYGVETVGYFEGHGTGTAVGDATEIQALSEARRSASASVPAALSTIKGNFGHTKAAAGVAGLIKATLAIHHQVIPPATGHSDPHPALTDGEPALFVPDQASPWPAGGPLRAGVSALGFGGINTHVAVAQATGVPRRDSAAASARATVRGRQDAELLLFDGPDAAAVLEKVARTAELVGKLSEAELTDLAVGLSGELSGGPVRAAVVVSDVDDAERGLGRLLELVADGADTIDPTTGVFLATRSGAPRLTFLFPGQGSGHGARGALRRRFAAAEAVFAEADLPTGGDQTATEIAQPRIVTGSLAGLRVLAELGVTADRAVGHSLGELTALHWGGALTEERLRALAVVRGRVMADASEGGGGMASLAVSPERAVELSGDVGVVVAGHNGPRQTVISGPAADVDEVCERARAVGVDAVRINVSHAFHSPLVAPAARAMADQLSEVDFQPVRETVVSTVTADVLPADVNLRELLVDQVLAPVRFHEAASVATDGAELALEVGPGRVLTGLCGQIAPGVPVVAVDTDSASIAPLLTAVGAAYALGAPVDVRALFADRLARPLPADGAMTFLANPCEAAPELAEELAEATTVPVEAAPAGATAGESTVDLLRRLAAARVELPVETIGADTHPLDDLHLSSITVVQLVNEAVRSRGLPALSATTNFATARLGDLAKTLDELAATAGESGDGGEPADGEVPGVAAWVRPMALRHVEMPVPRPVQPTTDRAEWTVFAPDGDQLAESLRRALAVAGLGGGVLLRLPEDGSGEVAIMLAAARAALTGAGRFVVVQGRFGASGLARTLHLEAPSVPTTVVTVDGDGLDIEAVVADVAATTGFAQVRHGQDGTRTRPVLAGIVPPAPAQTDSPLDGADVLLVTGGAKGITAECAMAMAKDSGAGLALLGRADPAADEEVATNLARMAGAGIEVRYERADVTSAEQVAAAVARFEAELGPVTAVLHGAGRNEPTAITRLTENRFHETLAPKVDGLRTVLDSVAADRIKLLVTFGSIIGRAGLEGEAHYATANDWLTELTVRFGEEHPSARVLAMEWSVWSGAGMGEKLGVVEALARDGITPISLEEGLAVLRQVLADPTAGPVLVVSGRTGGLPTIDLAPAELPMYRFLDRILAHYPDIELVTETDLSEGGDPYLSDHLLDGDLLFPAVVGMEAMAQVAAAVTGTTEAPTLEDVEFQRPIVVRPGAPTTIRIAALARDTGTVDVAIRSAETDYSVDHFRATVRVPRGDLPQPAPLPVADLPPVPLDPGRELYGGILFQGKRFQRLLGYRKASARRAVADIGVNGASPWFAPYLAQDMVLTDPAARDVVMHAIQCCVPDATLLPERLERLVPCTDPGIEQLVSDARERCQDGDSYTYDVDVRAPDGRLVERWEGLTLRAVRKRDTGDWSPALLGSLVERGLEREAGGGHAVIVEPVLGRDTEPDLALRRLLDGGRRPHPRPDGRADVDGRPVSVSHIDGLTMAVLGAESASLVPAEADADWAERLGSDGRAVADQLVAEGEPEYVACARVWAARVCLRAAGRPGALAAGRAGNGDWRLLDGPDGPVATWSTTVLDRHEEVVFAVLPTGS